MIATPAATNPEPPATPPPVVSPSLPLTDREFLDALRDPEAIDAIDPADYADRMERPEFLSLLAAHDDLRERRARLIADRRAEKAMDRLEAVLDHARDLDDPAQRTDTRRAAGVLARIASNRPAGRATSRRAPAQRPTGRSPAHESRAQPGARADGPPPPPRPPTPPCSQIPGLDGLIAEFVRAAADPRGLDAAAQVAAAHRKEEQGANFPQWLRSRCALVRDAAGQSAERPALTLYQDELDCAVRLLTFRCADPPVSRTCFIHAVVERYPEGPRWAVADIAFHDDTS